MALASSGFHYSSSNLQLQLSPLPLIDGVVDWLNTGVDSFGPLAAGSQQAQWADVLIDWVNLMIDGTSPTSPHSSGDNSEKAFPSA